MELSVLTEKQRESLKKMLKNDIQRMSGKSIEKISNTRKEQKKSKINKKSNLRTMKSRILNTMHDTGVQKIISDAMGDFELLNLIYDGELHSAPFPATLLDLLILETLIRYPDWKFESIINYAREEKDKKYSLMRKMIKSSSKEWDLSEKNEYKSMNNMEEEPVINDDTQKGYIYRLLHQQMEFTTMPVYMFDWNEIPGRDNKILIRILKRKHSWVEKAKIQKSDDGKTIKVFYGEKSISVNFDDTNSILKIKVGKKKKIEFNAKKKDSKMYSVANKYLTKKEIMEITNLSKSTIYRILKELADEDGLVECDKSSHPYKYYCKIK